MRAPSDLLHSTSTQDDTRITSELVSVCSAIYCIATCRNKERLERIWKPVEMLWGKSAVGRPEQTTKWVKQNVSSLLAEMLLTTPSNF